MSIPLASLHFSASYLQVAERVVRSKKGDVKREVFDRCHFDADALQDPDAFIDGEQFNESLSITREFLGTEAFASEQIIRFFPLTIHGEFGLALMTAPTVRDALELAVRYMNQVMPAFSLAVMYEEEKCKVYFTRNADFKENNDLLTEMVVGVAMKSIELVVLTQKDVNRLTQDIVLSLQHKTLVLSNVWNLFPIHFQLNAKENVVSIPVEFLDSEISTANPAMMALIEKNLEGNRVKVNREASMIQRVCELISEALIKGSILDLAGVADTLTLSPRTLSRRLKEEGASYQLLFGRCRMERAGMLLVKSDMSIGKIAFSLGFNNEANFSRAFKKHHGMSPSQCRGGLS